MRARSIPVTLLIAGALGAAAVGGCGDDSGDARSASDVPDGAVAVVGDQEVSQQRLDTAVAALERARRGKARQADRAALARQAVGAVLLETTIEQEARERGIAVDPAETRQRLDQLRRSFPSRAAYRRFLGRQTEADVLRQLRIQSLTAAVQADALASDGVSKKEFRDWLRAKWRDEIACQEKYPAESCHD